MNSVRILRLGRMTYKQSYKVQRFLQTARCQNLITDHVIITEHPPVYTLGLRKLAGDSLLWSPEEIRAKLGAEVVESFRGGDITFFGPGTLMTYPILHLKERRLTAYQYVDKLEDVMIDCLEKMGVEGCLGRIPEKRGVWTPKIDDSTSIGEKIGSIGIGMQKWVSIHGFALNVSTELKFFDPIVACGLHGVSMTTIEKELSRKPSSSTIPHQKLMETVSGLVVSSIPRLLGYDHSQVVNIEQPLVSSINIGGEEDHELPPQLVDQLLNTTQS